MVQSDQDPPGRLTLGVFQAHPTGRRLWGRPRTRWRGYISHLTWERPRIPQEELGNVTGEMDIWTTLLISTEDIKDFM